MFDKIRLHDRGELPDDYHEALGKGLDGRACRFLGIDYEELKARVLTGASDEEILAWSFEEGIHRADHECDVWNGFVAKLGWRDHRSDFLADRIKEYGYPNQGVQTFFDLIEIDEERPLRASYR
jgi:gluconokinase